MRAKIICNLLSLLYISHAVFSNDTGK